jgi:hypothetical protein
MKENIEEILKKALEHSQVEWPEEGHESRFVARLEEQKKSKGKIFKLSWVKYAAAAVAVGIGLLIAFYPEKQFPPVAQTDEIVHPAIEKAEAFYASRANLDWSSVDQSDEQVKQFVSSMQLLEKESRKLDSLLLLNINNEKIVQGLIDNYQYRLRVIEQLKKYIEIKNQLKKTGHENNI